MKNWKKIFVTSIPHQAEIVKGVLEENNMPAVIVPITSPHLVFDEYQVFVEQDQMLRAVNMIKNEISFDEPSGQ